MPSHTISVLVENEFGVLARVAGLFSGRGFNIESLTVAADPLDPSVSRIVLVAEGDDQILEQINKQLNKLVSVIKVTDFKGVDTVDREMVMVKVAVDERTRSELDSIVQRVPRPRNRYRAAFGGGRADRRQRQGHRVYRAGAPARDQGDRAFGQSRDGACGAAQRRQSQASSGINLVLSIRAKH